MLKIVVSSVISLSSLGLESSGPTLQNVATELCMIMIQLSQFDKVKQLTLLWIHDQFMQLTLTGLSESNCLFLIFKKPVIQWMQYITEYIYVSNEVLQFHLQPLTPSSQCWTVGLGKLSRNSSAALSSHPGITDTSSHADDMKFSLRMSWKIRILWMTQKIIVNGFCVSVAFHMFQVKNWSVDSLTAFLRKAARMVLPLIVDLLIMSGILFCLNTIFGHHCLIIYVICNMCKWILSMWNMV
jgi:hypothetical protein